jgi:DNA primase
VNAQGRPAAANGRRTVEDVTIVMDADRAGRLAAQLIQRDLTDVARTVTTADLAPDRQDGYDVTD